MNKAQRQGKAALDLALEWRNKYGTPDWITLYEAHDLTAGLIGKPVNKLGAAAMVQTIDVALKLIKLVNR